MEHTKKAFGKRLKDIRNKRGVSMAYVADRVGVARSTYAGYETQERFPPIEVLAGISEILGTSTDYLIGLTEDPEPKTVPKNIEDYLSNVGELNWNGIPLTNDDLKPLRDLFQIVVRERLPKMKDEQDKCENDK